MMQADIKFYATLLKASMKAAISKRGAFLLEMGILLSNHLIYFLLWWLFFGQFKEVQGWQFNDVLFLLAVSKGSYGLMQVCFGGSRDLSRMIASGDLDSFMIQPKNVLLHLSASKSYSRGWGNLISCAALLYVGALLSFSLAPVIILSLLSGCLVFTSINIIAHSLSFWVIGMDAVARKYCEALMLFTLYPTNIYSGFLKVLLFTFLPAGVITYLPVELVRNFSWLKVLLLMSSALSFMLIAYFLFYFGLRRYVSGNHFTAKA